MELKEVLKKLCLCAAPAGAESEIYRTAKELMEPYGTCRTDKRGNFICTKEGSGTHFLLDAHMDQIGLAVTSIEEGGFLKFGKVGGMDRRVLPGSEMLVLGTEPLYGIVSTKPPHLVEESEQKKAPKFEDMAMDTGLSREALLKKVSLGDKVVYKPYFGELLGENVTATALDDRAGMAIIFRTMEILKTAGSTAAVSAVFSVGEEVGGKGADNASFACEADEAIAIDVSFASQKEVADKRQNSTMPLGGGAFIGVAPILCKEMTDGLIACAEKHNIDYRIEVMSGKTGTNADGIAAAKYGTKTAMVSPPIRNMHTPVEIANLNDLEQCAQLIAHYILSKEGK
ncbi:MAG: M42 family peptidase [Clostridia bacterium]|nr:M42 family peptidase [Clostridia bacterium]